nr:hypothetical protein [Candidatus Sigynarchaeum springense]
MARESNPTGSHDATATCDRTSISDAYAQKLVQAKSWMLQGKFDTARAWLLEAKEIAVLNHLDKAPLLELEAKISLREAECGMKSLINQDRWSEARALAASLGNGCSRIDQEALDRRIACWMKIIDDAEQEKRRQPAIINTIHRKGI